MRPPLLAALLLAAAPALAEDAWRQVDTTTPATGLPASHWVASVGAQRLEVHCDGAGGLMMILFGGDTELPAEVRLDTEMPLALRLAPSGETRTVIGSWLGPFDNALNGGFPADPGFLDAFERATTLTITGPAGGRLIETPMSGARWARFGFGEVCGV